MLCAVLWLALALRCARAETHSDVSAIHRSFLQNSRALRSIGGAAASGAGGVGAGCLYGGRWYGGGAGVVSRDACLRCRCARGGAVSCARRPCAQPPDPMPRRCHMRHRRGACCPEMHCPDGVTVLEQSASARVEHEEDGADTPYGGGHHVSTASCLSDGVVYAAGSALSAGAACEACFCLGGRRRCVRPRCLAPPAGCRARPATGACCPEGYHCDRRGQADSTPPPQHQQHDCEVNGEWIAEGERVLAAEAGSAAAAGAGSAAGGNCTQCFCLRGGVRCAALACAPPLHGCRPLLRPGHCCPHQYTCAQHHTGAAPSHYQLIADNALVTTRSDDRSLHVTKPIHPESTSTLVSPARDASPPPANAKVKRKTSDPPHPPAPAAPAAAAPATKQIANTPAALHTTQSTTAAAKVVSSTHTPPTEESLATTTEQPEGSVRIMINGTINCTAELSSTSLPMNFTANDTERILLEAQPRVPSLAERTEEHTSAPSDIITDRNMLGDFDDSDIFTINVTSSLRHNASAGLPAAGPAHTTARPLPPTEHKNISKKTKGDYDYDYTEPTLPPSLPNLKIIPFVAADAVVDEDVPPKETLTYQMSEREDKFPIYYPTVESKNTPFATRREDVYRPTQYPVFVSNNMESARRPVLSHEVSLPSMAYPGLTNELVTPARPPPPPAPTPSRPPPVSEAVTKPQSTSTTFKVEAPTVNLFSPPVETEGGFIPKGPGLMGEYYAVYPSTHAPASVPHLTTSMQLDTGNGECVSVGGVRVPAGGSVSVSCSVCACAWGELHCAPRACAPAPPGCARRPAAHSAGDMCCGQLVCQQANKTTSAPTPTTQDKEETPNETKIPLAIKSEILPFDPPPDRSVPTTTPAERTTRPDTTIRNDTKVDDTTQKPIAVNNITSTESNDISTKYATTSGPVPSVSPEAPPATSTVAPPRADVEHHAENATSSQSQEYEDDDDDEGFSFGSVLKLLLSDSYGTTPAAAPPRRTTTTPAPSTSPPPPPTPRRPVGQPPVAPFVPLPHHSFPKKALPQTTVNRIDHLVLGEATAIRRPTARPATAPLRVASVKPLPARPTSARPDTTRPPDSTAEHAAHYPAAGNEVSPAPAPGGGGGGLTLGTGGLLKLAGCNIYGEMYRVGRIIAELSTPCSECRCTELGVQCAPRPC